MDPCNLKKNGKLVVTKNKTKKPRKKPPHQIFLAIMLRSWMHVVNPVLRNITSTLYSYRNFRGQYDYLYSNTKFT